MISYCTATYWEEHLHYLDDTMAFYSANGSIHINTDTVRQSTQVHSTVRIPKISLSPSSPFKKQLYQYHASLLISMTFAIQEDSGSPDVENFSYMYQMPVPNAASVTAVEIGTAPLCHLSSRSLLWSHSELEKHILDSKWLWVLGCLVLLQYYWRVQFLSKLTSLLPLLKTVFLVFAF